jgi:hypothetical protein
VVGRWRRRECPPRSSLDVATPGALATIDATAPSLLRHIPSPAGVASPQPPAAWIAGFSARALSAATIAKMRLLIPSC